MNEIIRSEKNGSVVVKTQWNGKSQVWVDNYDQTSRYTNVMWSRVLPHVPHAAHIRHVLLLGLGAGGIVPLLLKRFPSCSVTALEWDEVMIDLAKKNIPSRILSRLRIIKGDARETLPLLTQLFDCIILDLFRGKKVSPLLSEPVSVQAVKSRLDARGYLLANFFEEPSIAESYVHSFSLERIIRYQYNRLFIFRPHGAGVLGSPLPNGYVQYRMCRPYMEREAERQRATTIIGSDACPGYRTRYGAFAIEKFFGDEEPDCSGGRGPRLICWRPFTRRAVPRGWLQTSLAGNIGLTGFARVKGEYWKTWEGHAQRHRTRWLKNTEWLIEEISLENFLSAYAKTKKELTLKKLFAAMLRRKVRAHGERVRLVGVRRASNASPVQGGFASLTIPEIGQAVHLISFIHKAARDSSAGVGMMDDWFDFALGKNLRFLDFGLFWKRGEPNSWKPWSNFKAQFGIHYLMHPDPLLKIVRK